MAEIRRLEDRSLYQPANQSQGFNVPQAPDLITPLRQSQQAQQNEMAANQQIRRDELQLQQQSDLAQMKLDQGYQVALMERQGVLLKNKQLIEKLRVEDVLSITKGGQAILKAGEDAYEEYATAEGAAAFYDDLEAQEQERLKYQAEEQALSVLDHKAEEVALAAAQDNAPHALTSRYQQLWGKSRRAYAVEAAKHFGSKEVYSQYITNGLNSDRVIPLPNGRTLQLNKPDKTNEEYAAARAYLKDEYLQWSGLYELPRGVLATHAYPSLREADAALSAEYEVMKADNDSITERSEARINAFNTYQKDPLFASHLLNSYALSTKDGKQIGFGGAWREIEKDIVQMADNGQDVTAFIEAFKAAPIPGDPKGRTYGELHGLKLDTILMKAYDENRKNFSNKQTAARQMYQELRAKGLAGLTPNSSAEDIEELENRLKEFAIENQIYEGADPVLARYRQDPFLNNDAARQVRMSAELELAKSQGLLTSDMVTATGSTTLINRYMNDAINQEKAYNQVGGLKDTQKAVEAHIKADPRVQLQGKLGELGGKGVMVAGHYKRWVAERVQQIMMSGVTNDPVKANEIAFQEFTNKWTAETANPNGEFFLNTQRGSSLGFINYGAKVETITKAVNADFARLTNLAKQDPNFLDKPEVFGDRTWLLNSVKNFGQPGWQPDQRIVKWARQMGKSPLEIYNRQIKAMIPEMPPLALDKVIEHREASQSPAYKAFLDNLFTGAATRSQYSRYSGGDLPVRSGLAGLVPGGNVARLRAAFISQESSGDHTAVNARTGAVGLGQVMPENVGPWTQKYLGREMSYNEFRYNRMAQEKLLNAMYTEMFQRHSAEGRSEEEAVRRAAAEWYGGPGAVEHWNNPGYHANVPGEPNMAQYTQSIWRKYSR